SLAITSISATPYWKKVVPEDKEVVYEYKALVKAGTHIPHPFASEFLLIGKLHLQLESDNQLWVWLDNLQYKIDNGREGEYRKSTMHSSDLTHITKPFKVIYEDSGIVKEIVCEEDEPEYSLNMKKAIAATLQMNWEKIPLDSVKPFAFNSREKSTFGVDNSMYNIMPKSDILKIYRMHYMSSTEHMYSNLMSDYTYMGCDAAYEEPLTHDTQKLYIIDRKNLNEYKLKYMESNGGVYYQPSQARSTAFYVYVNQTFKMLEVANKKTSLTIVKEARYPKLTYNLDEDKLPFEHVPDPSTLMLPVEEMLTDLIENLQEDKINAEKPDMGQGQLVNRIIKVFQHFDVAMFEQLHTKLSTKTDEKGMFTLKAFQQIVPMVGSTSSLKFITKLVRENKLNEEILTEMLQNMAFYIRIPTTQLLTELSELLHFTNTPWSLQKAAILSFSTLLHKLNEFNRRQGIHNIEIFDKYIQEFINKIKLSKNLEEQYLYLDALYNMKNDLVIKYLEPLMKGEWFNDNRLRYKTMLVLSSVMTKHVHHDKMYELYWPIMTDITLPTYMRIMAFFLIMKSKPSLSCQINIYSFMQRERDMDFLNFYYTYLKSLTDSKSPCNYRSRLQAKQLLLYWPISYAHSLTQFQKFDMTDWQYNYGESHELSFINTKEAIIFMWRMDVNSMNFETNPNSLYVKITGVDRRLFDNVYLNTKKGMKYINYDQLLTSLVTSNYENLQVELIHLRHRHVVETRFFDKNTIASMSNYLKMFYQSQFSDTKKSLQIHYDMITKMLVPTDIGFPVLLDILMPSVHETKTKLSIDETNKVTNINIDNRYRVMNYFSYGLSFHNPFASVWQGISKFMNMDTQLPIYMGVSLNPQQNTLKLSWKRHPDPNEDIIGSRSYTATYVYVTDYLHSEILQTITPTANNYVQVAHNDNYKHNVSLLDSEDYNTGYKYTIQVFNDENPKYYQRFPLAQDFFTGMEPWHQQLLKYTLYRKYLQFQDDVITERGVLLKLEPSTTNPITNVDLTMRLNNEITDEAYSLFTPAMKINARATYTIKNVDKTVKTWDAVAVWDLNNRHTENSLKVDITRHIPGQDDYKICAQGTEKYGEKDLTGHLTVMMGKADGGKCTKDETAIYFNMKATHLPEQEQRLNNFEICHRPIIPLIDEMRPYTCYTDRSSLRYYTVDIKTVNFPTEFKNTVMQYWRMFLTRYHNHYIYTNVLSQDVTVNNLRIQFRYPISRDVIDMRFITPMETHKFKALPANDFARIGIYPDNLYYSNMNHFFHTYGLTDLCIIDREDVITVKGERLSDVIGSDWTAVVVDKSDNTKRGIWVKMINNQLLIKAIRESNTLMIMPTTDGKFTVTLNGKDLGEVEHIYQGDMILSKMEDSNTLLIFHRRTGVQLIHNGYQVLLEMLKTDMAVSGKCMTTSS
ncbi:Lipoprotein amino terminal region, partial [Popillia japonica]